MSGGEVHAVPSNNGMNLAAASLASSPQVMPNVRQLRTRQAT